MELAEQVKAHCASKQAFAIAGGGTKQFLGPVLADLPVVSTITHSGIVEYEPAELILRARAGTRVSDIREALAAEGQMLGFEPPEFDGGATLGGAIASGLAGGRRPWYGAPRDFVLGVGLVTATGEYLEFGGQVMKNVAGFDVSRLMAGSFGTLGLIADVSLKVLPRPERELTVTTAMDTRAAHQLMLHLSNQSLPLSGACHGNGNIYLRFSGSDAGVTAALEVVRKQADMNETVTDIWTRLSHFRLPGVPDDAAVWRISVPAASDALIADAPVLDWGGAQRFLVNPGFNPRDRLEGVDGHATRVRGFDPGISAFERLSPPILALHQRLKQTFDPAGLMNPGRMYPGL